MLQIKVGDYFEDHGEIGKVNFIQDDGSIVVEWSDESFSAPTTEFVLANRCKNQSKAWRDFVAQCKRYR